MSTAPVGTPAAHGAGRRVGFDVLRVGAVALVVLYHGTFIGPLVHPEFAPRPFVVPHQIGASLLLTFSAYFAAASLGRSGSAVATARWWWGRLARIVPAFVVATVVAWWALREFAPPLWFHPDDRDLAGNLLMLWNWDPAWWGFVDASYWTIPLQLMAFTVAAALRRTPLGRGRALRVLLWAAVLVPLAQWHHRLLLPRDSPYAIVADGLGLHRWHLFVAGVAVWMLATGRLGRGHGVALISVAVAAHTVQTTVPDPATGAVATDPIAVAGIALGVLALLAVALVPSLDQAVPPAARPVIGWLAGISYGVFLVHQTLGYLTMRALQDLGAGAPAQLVALGAASVLLGWGLTRAVESPAHHVLLAAAERGLDGVRALRAVVRPAARQPVTAGMATLRSTRS